MHLYNNLFRQAAKLSAAIQQFPLTLVGAHIADQHRLTLGAGFCDRVNATCIHNRYLCHSWFQFYYRIVTHNPMLAM